MSNINLTDVERLILANQYEILSILKEDDGYERLAEELRDGHEWLYSQSLEHVSSNMPAEEADYVITILGIYSDLRDSYEKLEDKSDIKSHQVEFPGFDGNNESDLLSFSKALRKHDRFTETLPEHGKNSHMPTTDIYRRMISKWNELGRPNYPYDKETILNILNERIHPSNR